MSLIYYNNLYGIECNTLEEGAKILEAALNIQMQEHDSDFFGDYCACDLHNGRRIRLYCNDDHHDHDPGIQGEIMEPDFPTVYFIIRTRGFSQEESDYYRQLLLTDQRISFLRCDIINPSLKYNSPT
jgi:hypothetical protein